MSVTIATASEVETRASNEWGGAKILARDLQSLKARDNRTNFRYLALNYAIFAATVAVTLWCYGVAAASGLGLWLTVPMTALAVVIIGGFQHQLGGAIHEGTHYILFADKRQNELVSDWLAAFPIYTSTYSFRLHHLAHHQFVNDPSRDPNFAQAKESGHWLDFPLTHIELLVACLKQLNPVRLVMYILARAKYSALGSDKNPYADPERPGMPWAIRAGVLYAVGMPTVLIFSIASGWWAAAALAFVAGTAATLYFYWRLPDSGFPQSRINPVVSHRATAMGRVGFMAIVYGGLSLAEFATGAPAWGYFLLLWILPLFTTFPLFMILREWLQHGNADRGRLTNSRIFIVNPVLRYLVFPWGMDYHLPHHIFCSVPHYKLKDLHELMLAKDADYRENALVVERWIGENDNGRPSVIEVLGPKYARANTEIVVADETLELADVNNAAAIQAQSEASRAGR